MKVYTAQEWQIKFKEQAGKDKQLLHDLECTGLVKEEDAQKEISNLKDEVEIWKKNRNIYVEKKNKLCRQIEEANKKLENALSYLPNGSEVNNSETYLISGASLKELRDIANLLNPRKEEREQ